MDVFGSSERDQTISNIEKSNKKIKSDLSALGQTLENKISVLENNMNAHFQKLTIVENKIVELENKIQKLTTKN